MLELKRDEVVSLLALLLGLQRALPNAVQRIEVLRPDEWNEELAHDEAAASEAVTVLLSRLLERLESQGHEVLALRGEASRLAAQVEHVLSVAAATT